MAPSKSKPPPSACPDAALEYHLSSVSLSYNNLEYSVVGRIAYDFRADGAAEEPELDRVQLKPLIQPESQSLSSSIELHFSGRWRAACAFLRKRDVVCVYNARVEPSRDREIHDVQLVLLDGPAATRGTRAKTSRPPASLFLLHGDGRYRRATDVVTATHLAQGRIPCERPPVAAEPPPNPQSPAPTSPAPEPPAQPAPAGRRRSSQRLQRSSLRLQERVAKRTRTGPIRTYTYRTIDSLWQEADSLPPPSGGRRSSPGGTFNAYGVVMEACAASVTARTDLRSELVLVDETSMLSTDAIPERRALMVYRFNRDSRCALPFRAVGDIVRCHRLQLNRYSDSSGRMQVQGAAQSHSSFLMWAGDSESEEPIFSLTSNNSRGEASHTMTEGDHARVAALRNFSRTYVAGLTATHNSFLHTVSDVLHSPLGSEIFSKKFDIIARHKPAQVVGVGDTIGGVQFCVRDGRDGAAGDLTLRAESVLSDDHIAKCKDVPFKQFAKSFELGRAGGEGEPLEWMLITDVHVGVLESGQRRLKLSVGKRTSSVLWLPTSAPQVRYLLTAPAVTAANSTDVQSRATDMTPSHAALQEVAEQMIAEDAAARESLQKAMNTRWHSLGTHKGMHLPEMSVLSVLRAVERGECTLTRLRARVRSWVTPADLRFAAIPYCAQCDEYRWDQGDQCAFCGDGFGWGYLARLVLADDIGTWIYAWVEGTHAKTFFGTSPQSAEPCNLAKNRGAALHIKRVADALLRSDTRLDCLVQPYSVMDDNGVKHIACRVLYTAVHLGEGADDADET